MDFLRKIRKGKDVRKKNKRSLREFFRYYCDLWLSKGAVSMTLLLLLITGIVMLILAVFVVVLCARQGMTFRHAFWETLTHTLDPGVLANEKPTILLQFMMLLATLCGVFFTALLIAAVNDGISSRVSELAKGLEPVIEQNHVVVLGFNESTFIIIGELIEAYDNQAGHRNAVVIMDQMDKQEMEERIRAQFPRTGNIKIVCRSGVIYNQTDLDRCSILTSKSIIIAVENDFETIKTIIACTQMLNDCENSQSFVTAVINERQYEFAARIAGNDKCSDNEAFSVGNDRLELLMLESTISKIMTHTSRQMGLSKVFIEIFDYEGNEFYIVRNEGRDAEVFDRLSGKTIREINQYLHNAFAIGVIDAKGKVIIGDPNTVGLDDDCKLVVLEEDDDRIIIGDTKPSISYDPPKQVYEDKPISILIIDCNTKLPTVLEEMGNYLDPGSEIYLAEDPDELAAIVNESLLEGLTKKGLTIHKCPVEGADLYEYPIVEKIIDECDPDFLLVMSSHAYNNEEADAQSLKLLLYCKHYKETHEGADFGVTCEMRNVANQKLADVLMSSDFVVSRNIAALMMSQIAENRELKDVFENLLVSEGYEIYIKPAEYYLDITGETEVDLFSLSEAVAEKQEVFIGYKINVGGDGEPVLCPNKSKNRRSAMVTLHEGDQLVVLAEDMTVKS